MKCPNCNSEGFNCMVNMTVSFPIDYYYKLTKKVVRSKDFKILGVDWGDCDFTCNACGYTVNKHPQSQVLLVVNPEDLIEKEEGN